MINSSLNKNVLLKQMDPILYSSTQQVIETNINEENIQKLLDMIPEKIPSDKKLWKRFYNKLVTHHAKVWDTDPLIDNNILKFATMTRDTLKIPKEKKNKIVKRLRDVKLRDYQITSVYVMRMIEEHQGYGSFHKSTTTRMYGWTSENFVYNNKFMWNTNNCAILANSTGSGKTLVITSLIKTYKLKNTHSIFPSLTKKSNYLNNLRQYTPPHFSPSYYTQKLISKISNKIDNFPALSIQQLLHIYKCVGNIFKMPVATIKTKEISYKTRQTNEIEYNYYPYIGWCNTQIDMNVEFPIVDSLFDMQRSQDYVGYSRGSTVNHIFCKGNLVPQWINEFNRANITYIKANREFKITLQRDELKTYVVDQIETAEQNNVDVIFWRVQHWETLTTYIKANNIAARIIIDEYDTLQITSLKDVPQSAFTWFISGTWSTQSQEPYKSCMWNLRMNSYNREVENNCISTDIPVVRCDPRWIASKVKLPDIHFNYYHVHTNIIQEAVIGGSLGNNQIQQLINSGNTAQALTQMGCRSVETDQDMYEFIKNMAVNEINDLIQRRNETRKKYKQLINQRKEEGKHRVTKEMDNLKNRIDELRANIDTKKPRVIRLKKLCSQTEHECCICMSEQDRKNLTVLDCCQNAILCTNCMDTLLKDYKKCPQCRRDFDSETLWVKSNGTSNSGQLTVYGTKEEALIDVINNCGPDSKILIFSFIEKSCDELRLTLINLYPYRGCEVLYPSELKSGATIRRFRNNDTSILLAGARQVASGLHLPEITDVIFMQNIEGATAKQCITRAYRYPRTTELNVHTIIYKNEISREKADDVENWIRKNIHCDSIDADDEENSFERELDEIDRVVYNENYFDCLQ